MIGRILSGRYKVVSMIGEGGMSVVWRAQDMNTGKLVAVKVLRDEYRDDETFIRRFEREALAASRMTHPNIANLLDVGLEEDGTRYLVIEYVSGITLKQFIRDNGAIRPDTASQIIMRVLAAVQHAHQNGVIHRDIKPQNILLDKEGAVKVSDFGIARVANSQTMSQDTDTVMGSVYYFSPEQAKGAVVDEKSDIYSVGVVFYEMLTGRVPFTGDTPVAIAMRHLQEAPMPPSEAQPAVPAALDYVVLHAMEKRPRNRYQTAADMLRDVRLALEHPDTILAARQEMERRDQEARRDQRRRESAAKRTRTFRRLLLSAFSLLLLGLMALAGYTVMQRIILAQRNTIEMPSFYGMTEERAKQIAVDELKLNVHVSTNEYPLVQDGLVAEQSIAPGTFVRPGSTLSLIIAKSKYDLRTPNLVGMANSTAQKTLIDLSLAVGSVTYEVSAAAPDTVIRQYPEHSVLINTGQSVDLVISEGLVIVPKLIGMDLTEAELKVGAYSLYIIDVKNVVTEDPLSVGKVITQAPAANESVRPNTGITITIGTASPLLIEATVTLDLTALPAKGGTVSVKMEEPGGGQTTRFSSTLEEHADTMDVPVYSDTAYTARYQVYFDGVLQYSSTVEFIAK